MSANVHRPAERRRLQARLREIMARNPGLETWAAAERLGVSVAELPWIQRGTGVRFERDDFGALRKALDRALASVEPWMGPV